MRRKSTFMLASLSLIYLASNAGNNNGEGVSKTEYKTFTMPANLSEKDYEPNTIIFRLKPEYRAHARKNGVELNALNEAFVQIGAQQISKIYPRHNAPAQQRNANGVELVDLSLIYQTTFTADISLEKAINIVLASGKVVYAEPRYTNFLHVSNNNSEGAKTTALPPYTPNDPGLSNAGSYYITRIKCPDAWGVNTTTARGDTNVVIGIVDSGSDWDHPDCFSKWKRNMADPINGVDDDNDGYVDNYRGWDISENDNDPMNANSSHGSHVAGLAAAATDNGVGVASPGFRCKFLPVKCSNDASTTQINNGYEGITYAADHGSKVINCSWGGGGAGSYGQDVVKYATINKDALVIASAGNDGVEKVNYPCAYDYVMCVSNTTNVDTKSSSSTFGYHVDIAAPGTNVYSTIHDNSYSSLTGTSMSSPICAGAAGIVRSFYPAYTALQAAEQLKVTADNIYTGGTATYKDKLGTGRLNLYRALTESKPSIWMTPINVTDGNDDAFLGGETLSVTGVLTNYLAATANLTCTLSTTNTNVTILNSTASPGVINTMGTYTVTTPSAFTVLIKPAAPVNDKINFKLTYNDGTYSGYQYFTVVVNVDFINIYINDVGSTQTSRGRAGYNNGDATGGIGFVYKDSSLIYEAGLMIGVSNTKVVDNVRGSNPTNDLDFVSSQVVKKVTPSVKSDFDTYGLFTDNGATGEKIGLSVRHNSYAWDDAGYRKFIIFEYIIKNTSGGTLSNLYAGMEADWDITDKTYAYNKVATDNTNKLGYTYSTIGGKIYAGTKLLTAGPFLHYAIDNVAGGGGGVDLADTDQYSPADKYLTLSTSRATSGAVNPGGNDVLNVVSTGPFTINNNDSITVAFALLAGDDLNDITITAVKAQEKYDGITSVAGKGISETGLSLKQNYPNPVNGNETVIGFSLPGKANAELSIYNVMGQKVLAPISATLPAGTHQVTVNTAGLADGIYYYQLKAGDQTQTMKMTITR